MVMLSDLSPSEVTFTDHTAIGTITKNDATGIVVIKVADAKASEASSEIIFQVTSAFPAATGSPFTFGYEAVFGSGSTYASSDDFAGATNGTANIPASSDSTTISISLMSDTTIEPDETFSLRLTNLSANATIDRLNYKGTILNDDLGEISDATAIIGDEKITLNWTNPNSNIFARAVIAYQESSTTAPATCSDGMTQLVNNALATSDTIIDLTNGTAYSVRICAKSTTDRLSGGVPLINLIAGDIDGDGVRQSIDVDDDNDGLIEIATATELNNIRHNLAGTGYKTSSDAPNFTRGCPNNTCIGYELTASIDLSSFNSGTWDPIGSSSDRFTAIFDGNNNRISGLDISSDSDYVGLFSAMEDATIRNLKLAKVKIIGNSFVGALVGDATGTNTLSNIELIGDKSQSSSDAEIKGIGNVAGDLGANIGGLVGRFAGTITDSTSSLTVRGGSSNLANFTGGLVGWFQSRGSIKNSNNSGSVSASDSADNVGGLVGHAGNNTTIDNSWASGNVSSTGNSANWYGGLVGETRNGTTIENSWASGNVSSTGFLNSAYGGLVGRNAGGNISNSWASGNVSSTAGFSNSNYGGLVGSNNSGNISNSWASGNVTDNGNSNLIYGGLVGENGSGNISNSWASGEVTGDSSVGGLIGQHVTSISGGIVTGSINGRNYYLDSVGTNGIGSGTASASNSIELDDTTDLARLSGASGVKETHSDWHAGFGSDPFTMFCNTNGDGTIDTNEKVANKQRLGNATSSKQCNHRY